MPAPRLPLQLLCAAERLLRSSEPPYARGSTWSATGGSLGSPKGLPHRWQVTADARTRAASRVYEPDLFAGFGCWSHLDVGLGRPQMVQAFRITMSA
jgi:hypothetical protein